MSMAHQVKQARSRPRPPLELRTYLKERMGELLTHGRTAIMMNDGPNYQMRRFTSRQALAVALIQISMGPSGIYATFLPGREGQHCHATIGDVAAQFDMEGTRFQIVINLETSKPVETTANVTLGIMPEGILRPDIIAVFADQLDINGLRSSQYTPPGMDDDMLFNVAVFGTVLGNYAVANAAVRQMVLDTQLIGALLPPVFSPYPAASIAYMLEELPVLKQMMGAMETGRPPPNSPEEIRRTLRRQTDEVLQKAGYPPIEHLVSETAVHAIARRIFG